jgi:hypothetical protein
MKSARALKALIWTYLVLLLVEGALRKWVFPAYADLLLIVRDPVVLAIYGLALARGEFPRNGFVVATLALAAASIAASLLAGQHQPVVLLYGLRINYLHLPLIWIMAQTLDREDVGRIGTFLLLMALPMTLVMVLQFRSPMNAFINRGVGDEELGQIFGAAGRIRPPGLFAFITGPQLFLPLAAAFFLHQTGVRRRLPWLLLLACGTAIAVALPVSISRTAVLATGAVVAAYVAALPWAGRRGSAVVRGVLALGLVVAGLSFLPIFAEGRDVFLTRWQTAAAGSGGDAWADVRGRLFGGVLRPFALLLRAPLFGEGIGVGSNVGARLLSGHVGFLLAEDEWSKVILELGPVLGGAFLAFRVVLTGHLAAAAFRALRAGRDPLAALLFAAVGVAVFQFQWAPPTVLGFVAFGSGLLLAAARTASEPAAVPAAAPTPPVPAPARLVPAATFYRPPATPKPGIGLPRSAADANDA